MTDAPVDIARAAETAMAIARARWEQDPTPENEARFLHAVEVASRALLSRAVRLAEEAEAGLAGREGKP